MPERNEPNHPLAEVFGFNCTDFSEKAIRYRKNKLCPFNNKVPSCTKDKAQDPLGVCSIFYNKNKVITCPVRFREDWLIAQDAASFFFPESTDWTSLAEVNLPDKDGKTAGHIDLILVAYDNEGVITDFGSVEVQAVYISGNIRRPFTHYIKNPTVNADMIWQGKKNYPKPDFLSSSRKRLIPQMLYKGGIFDAWDKKQAVVLQKCFFDTLPELPTTSKEKASVAWLLYDLVSRGDRLCLKKVQTVYTKFMPAIDRISRARQGQIEDFLQLLQNKLDEKLENPPDAPTLEDDFTNS